MTAVSRLAGVVMAFVLSGTPALVMACATLCGPDMQMVASAPAPAVATSPSVDAHAHHAHPGAAAAADPTSRSVLALPVRGTRVSAEASGCCPNLDTVVLTRAIAAKTGAGALATPVLSQPTAFVPEVAAAYRLQAPPDRHRSSPARLPLVLRI